METLHAKINNLENYLSLGRFVSQSLRPSFPSSLFPSVNAPRYLRFFCQAGGGIVIINEIKHVL